MNRAEELSLAWALVDSAPRFLHPATRAWLCATIGAGELESAVKELLVCYSANNAELPWELAADLRTWLHGYRGSDSEAALHDLIGRLRVSRPRAAASQSRPAADPSPPRKLTATRVLKRLTRRDTVAPFRDPYVKQVADGA
jgi:hypothetical protein